MQEGEDRIQKSEFRSEGNMRETGNTKNTELHQFGGIGSFLRTLRIKAS
jgi:hypothetical protein